MSPHLPAAFPLPFRGWAMGGSSWSHGVGPAASVLMGTPGRLLALSSVPLAAPPEGLRSLLGYNWWSDAGAERVVFMAGAGAPGQPVPLRVMLSALFSRWRGDAGRAARAACDEHPRGFPRDGALYKRQRVDLVSLDRVK